VYVCSWSVVLCCDGIHVNPELIFALYIILKCSNKLCNTANVQKGNVQFQVNKLCCLVTYLT